MGEMLLQKSRREKRKEVRSSKKQNKYESWLHYQDSQKFKRDSEARRLESIKETMPLSHCQVDQENIQAPAASTQKIYGVDQFTILKKDEVKLDSSENVGSSRSKVGQMKKGVKNKSKTKFEAFLERDMQYAGVSAQEDLQMERRLMKKLKVKGGKLRGMDDSLNKIFKGIPSALECLDQGSAVAEENGLKSQEKKGFSKRRKRQESEYISGGADAVDSITKASEAEYIQNEVHPEKPGKGNTSEMVKYDSEVDLPETSGKEEALKEVPVKTPMPESTTKWVPRRCRAHVGSEAAEHSQIRGSLKGLLNRLSESNIESVTGEAAMLYRSVPRNVGSQILSEEILKHEGGPLGREQDAAVFGAFVAGMACSVGVDFSAKILASLAKKFEDNVLKEDNISLKNLTRLLSYLYIFGVCSSDLIYDFLVTLSDRFKEIDVSTILTVLQCCGMKIRSDDPAAMKNLIDNIQKRVNKLKASPENGQENSKRMEFMLETLFDIKNNKKRTKVDSLPHTRIKKWLQKLRVEDILIRGIKWSKLLDPNKKGQWWLSGDAASAIDEVAEVASKIDKEVLEAQKMLRLASAQGMNTDARRAIFCVIMSAMDPEDAFEKLLALDLRGEQDRDIIRVLVDCCLKEQVFNKYYTNLASKLCEHDKNHTVTFKYCIWDHFKKLEEMNLRASMHLAKFAVEMATSNSLHLGKILEVIDFGDPVQLTPKRIMHFRMLFEALLVHPKSGIWNVFTRLAVDRKYEPLRYGIEIFVKEYVIRSNNGFEGIFEFVRKALRNIRGRLYAES